jgi:hypothetical protein
MNQPTREKQPIKTVLVGRDGGDKTLITCDYGAAIIMRIYEDGDVAQLSLDGEEMDKICEAWTEYRAREESKA